MPFDDPAVIASGPTVPRPVDPGRCPGHLREARHPRCPRRRCASSTTRTTRRPRPAIHAFARAEYRIIRPADRRPERRRRGGRAAGYEPILLGADLEGEAREVAAEHAVEAKRAQRRRAGASR
ncbi:hypothetical protein ACU4GA_17795 [Methylobacterium oryzae CBMB20]